MALYHTSMRFEKQFKDVSIYQLYHNGSIFEEENWARGRVGGFVNERGSGIPEQWLSALDFPVSAFPVGRRNTNIVN